MTRCKRCQACKTWRALQPLFLQAGLAGLGARAMQAAAPLALCLRVTAASMLACRQANVAACECRMQCSMFCASARQLRQRVIGCQAMLLLQCRVEVCGKGASKDATDTKGVGVGLLMEA